MDPEKFNNRAAHPAAESLRTASDMIRPPMVGEPEPDLCRARLGAKHSFEPEIGTEPVAKEAASAA